MTFTEKEKLELGVLANQHPVIKKALAALEEINLDPAKAWAVAVSKMANKLAIEMDDLSETKLGIISTDKDDKTFERIRNLLIDGGKIADSIKRSKDSASPEEEEKQAPPSGKAVIKRRNYGDNDN